MKNVKFVIISIILILAIILLIVTIMITRDKDIEISKNILQIQEQSTKKEQDEIEQSSNIKNVDNSAMYFTVKSCVDKYIKYIAEKNEEAIYSVLSERYIQEHNIKTNNVLDFITRIDGEHIDFKIMEMKVENDGEKLQTYYIKGIIRNENDEKKETNITISVDTTNKVFTVIPYVEKGVFYEQEEV